MGVFQDCENYFKRSLFLMGEIGGNDYNFPFFIGGSIEQLQAMVPLVVEAIVAATSVSPNTLHFYHTIF